MTTGTSVNCKANSTVFDDAHITLKASRSAAVRQSLYWPAQRTFSCLAATRYSSTAICAASRMIRIQLMALSRDMVHILLMAPLVSASRLIGVVRPMPLVSSSVLFLMGITGPHRNMNTRS